MCRIIALGFLSISLLAATGCGDAEKARIKKAEGELQEASPQERAKAALELARSGEGAAKSASKLLPLLKDPEAIVRKAAVDALSGLDIKTPDIISTISPLLKDSDEQVRISALYALFSLEAYEPAIQACISFLGSDSEKQRLAAVTLLADYQPGAPAAMDALILALDDEDTTVQASAARALGNIGKEAAVSSSGRLKSMAQSDEEEISAAAREALEKMQITP